MGFFDDIFGQPFGGMFDINGDGKTDLGEEWLGYMALNECMKEEKENDSYYSSSLSVDDDLWQLDCEDGSLYVLNPYDYESKLEYKSALKFAKAEAKIRKNEWRNYCEDGLDYGIDPEDFENDDEYNEALEEAKDSAAEFEYEPEPEITVPINLSFTVVSPGQEYLDEIKEENYPNKRQYNAAYRLCELQHDIGYIPYNSTKETEIEKCNFILSSETVAAKYLTVSDGFLLVQAIKENFELPLNVDDEDEKVINNFNEIFLQIAEENTQLAVDIWTWIIKKFGPYKKYMSNDWAVYNRILADTNDYPDEFLPLVIKRLGEDIIFCNELITQNPQFPDGMSTFITNALELNLIKEAQIIFTAVAMNTKAKVKDMENLINAIISESSNWEELETMEKFKNNILPIIKKMNSKRIQRLYPKFENNVDEYICSVESSEEKYQYSRKFAWRLKYKDTPLFNVDPLDFETEAEYLTAVKPKRQSWGKMHAEAKFYDIDLEIINSEHEYQEELNKKKSEQILDSSNVHLSNTSNKTHIHDDTIYNFCAVVFQNGVSPYIYLCDNTKIEIGDIVVVPIGSKARETNAKVVAVMQHTRLTAPIEIERAKKILRVIKAK